MMKLVIARMSHETNTYSPVPTPLERFAARQADTARGRARDRRFRGTGPASADS